MFLLRCSGNPLPDDIQTLQLQSVSLGLGISLVSDLAFAAELKGRTEEWQACIIIPYYVRVVKYG